MKRAQVVAVALLLVAAGGLASAQEEVTKKNYPASMVERPMILPPLMFQPSFEGDLTNVQFPPTTLTGQGGTIAFGLDVGIVRRFQAGVFFAFPVHPVGGFGDFLANAQINLVKHTLNFRADLGAEQVTLAGGGASFSKAGFYFALGLPLKVKLHRVFALTSGSTWARGIHSQPHVSTTPQNNAGLYGSSVQTNQLLTFFVFDAGGAAGGTLIGAFHLPIGFLIQPIPQLAFGIRTGYRVVFSSANNSGQTHWVPLAFDLVGTIARMVDLGFTAQILGLVATTGGTAGGTAVSSRWADVQMYDFWVGARF
jgi:hypothetical protein